MNWTQDVIDRFWSKVEYPGNDQDCWEWQAGKDKNGYGAFAEHMGYSPIGAHRLSWEYYNGNIPNNMLICHTCDNPPCVNPDHLFLATNIENMLDMKQKGRAARGSNNGNSKLTEIEVLDILTGIHNTTYTSIKDIQLKFKISKHTIYQLLDGKIWQHITTTFQPTISVIRNMIVLPSFSGKLDENDVRDIRVRLKSGQSAYSIAKLYGLNNQTISEIKHYKIWKNVTI